jgi:hypothetical protein
LPPPGSGRHNTIQSKIHEKLLAVGELVLFDELKHLEAGNPLPVHADDFTGVKLGWFGSRL